jgi:outer membrane protein assembly factor BamA
MSIFRSYLLLLILLPLSLSANERQINYIVIEGNTRLSSEEIIEYSGIKIGKIYEQDDIAVVHKRFILYQSVQ